MSGAARAGTSARDRPTSPVAPILYGDDAVLDLPAFVRDRGWQRVLLVCGRRSFEASGAARMLPELEAVASVVRWSDFAPNTDAADLVRGLQVVDDVDPDLILAVGGGSAIDMAKLLVSYDGRHGDAVHEAIRSGARVDQRRRGLVLVPTTSGSGAEVTHFAVVYIGDGKHSIVGSAMRADAIVLDPSLTLSGSDHQRATSGIDAVAQAIESLWATGATDTSRRFARHALRLVLPSIEPFVTDPTPGCARAMSIGSHLAGRAIDISRTTAAHALSYGLTKGYGVSHGHACALTLGWFIRLHAQAAADDLRPGVDADEHRRALGLILRRIGASGPDDAPAVFTALLRRIGLEPSLSALGIGSDAHEALASDVNPERLGNNPVDLTHAQLVEVLRAAA